MPYVIAAMAASVHCGACRVGLLVERMAVGQVLQRLFGRHRSCQLSLLPLSYTVLQGAYVIARSDNHPVAGELRGQLSPAVFKLTSSSSSS